MNLSPDLAESAANMLAIIGRNLRFTTTIASATDERAAPVCIISAWVICAGSAQRNVVEAMSSKTTKPVCCAIAPKEANARNMTGAVPDSASRIAVRDSVVGSVWLKVRSLFTSADVSHLSIKEKVRIWKSIYSALNQR